MMKTTQWMSAAITALGVLSISGAASASSHREAPAIANDPAADNTDLYAWVNGNNLIILANYIPLEEPAGGPNFHGFSDDVLYEVHITRGAQSLEPVITYKLEFSTKPYPNVDPGDLAKPVGGGKEFFSQISGATQTYTVTKVDKTGTKVLAKNVKVAPPNIGPRTNALAYQIPAGKSYEQFFVDDAATSVITSLGNGQGRVFAGPRDDGFYVDLGAVFDLAGLRILPSIANNPAYGAKEKTPTDGVAGYNTHTIALEIPLQTANDGNAVSPGADDAHTVGIWASAARRKVSIIRQDGGADTIGPWIQVSRLGLPLINEAIIGLQDKDRWNRVTPKQDVQYFGAYFLNPVVVRDAEFAGLYDAANPDGVLSSIPPMFPNGIKDLKSNRLDIVDVINLKSSGHNIPLAATGDVLRVDLGTASGFPNGRAIPSNGGNKEGADVTDVELSLILTGLKAPVPDGASANDKNFRATFPFLASPWEGFSEGHGKATAP
ncbi:MAG: DUF4331 domain-containing protein [Byssovorax sp.]